MAKIRKYGIKFPITLVSGDGTLVDMNESELDSVTSDIMHTIFTPKGQKLRDQEFGTNLIQFIFNPSDGQSWGDIVMEIKSAVTRNVPNCSVEDIEIAESDDASEIYAKIKYDVIAENGESRTYQIITRL